MTLFEMLGLVAVITPFLASLAEGCKGGRLVGVLVGLLVGVSCSLVCYKGVWCAWRRLIRFPQVHASAAASREMVLGCLLLCGVLGWIFGLTAAGPWLVAVLLGR